jgi:lysophospholipase L1-like esterase
MNFIRVAVFSLLAITSVIAVPIDPTHFSAPVCVACVGDSITEGDGARPGDSYPDQLQKLLGEHWKVGNFGISGRTLLRKGDFPYWDEETFTNAQNVRPDVVIILLGTNDTKPQNWCHGNEFAKDYIDLVKVFLALPGKPSVFVCLPPPVPNPGNYGINEAAIREEIPLIRRIAGDLKLGVIDMHAALDGKTQLLPDRVHPNDEGAGEMAKAAFNALTGKEPAVSGGSK